MKTVMYLMYLLAGLLIGSAFGDWYGHDQGEKAGRAAAEQECQVEIATLKAIDNARSDFFKTANHVFDTVIDGRKP